MRQDEQIPDEQIRCLYQVVHYQFVLVCLICSDLFFAKCQLLVKEHDGIAFTGGTKKTVAHRGPDGDHAGDNIEILNLVEDKRC